jgi:hypothetical protein
LFGRHSLWWQHALDPELTVKPGAVSLPCLILP